MRAKLIFMLATIFLQRGAVAQIPSIQVTEPYQEDRPLSFTDHRPWRIAVENHDTRSIVAAQATFHCPATGYYKEIAYTSFHDSLAHYGSDTDIPPGSSFELTANDPSSCSGKVDAVVFSDGHSEGDPQAIQEIYMRRRGVYEALSEITAHVDRVANQEETPQNVTDFLTSRDKSNGTNQSIDIRERNGMSMALGMAKMLLMSPGDMRVPSDSTANRQPGTLAVMKEMHITREQAHAIVLSRKLGEWSDALKDHLEPPVSDK
jgi:hypothetical protein